MPGVVPGGESAPMPYGFLVFGPLVGTNIAPIALQMARDEVLWILLGLDERHEGARSDDEPSDPESG